MEKSVVECGKIGFNSTGIRQVNDLQEVLLNKYVEILNKPEHQNLLRAISNKDNKLSNIHLGFVPEHYESAEHKILIVGRETRSWYDSKKFDEYHAENVRQLMSLSKDFIWRNLTGDLKRNTKGATFFNFVRNVAKRSGNEGILWANIFAVDYKTKHPKHSDWFEDIKTLSCKLLRAQIEILKPQIILFVSGDGGVAARRECFPDLSGSGQGINGLNKGKLEKFSFEGDKEIICYRAPHPSTRNREGRRALKVLVEELLPSAKV